MKNLSQISSSSAPISGRAIPVASIIAGAVFCLFVAESPSYALRAIISVLALILIVRELGRRAPVGYEDDKGFHLVQRRRA